MLENIAILIIGICVGWVISRVIASHMPKSPPPQDDFLPPVDVRHIDRWD